MGVCALTFWKIARRCIWRHRKLFLWLAWPFHGGWLLPDITSAIPAFDRFPQNKLSTEGALPTQGVRGWFRKKGLFGQQRAPAALADSSPFRDTALAGRALARVIKKDGDNPADGAKEKPQPKPLAPPSFVAADGSSDSAAD